MSARIELQFELITVQCSNCGVSFGIPDYFHRSLKRQHGTFYCLNGHSQWYPQENETEKYKRELEAERLKAEQARAFYRNSLSEKDRVITSLQGKVKRTETRIANGVCPCCNRQFKQVAAHMKRKHPEYRKGEKV